MSSTAELINDETMAKSLLGGGQYSSPQIKKRCKSWGVEYKALNGRYWFSESDFMEAFHREELSSAQHKRDTRKKTDKKKKEEVVAVEEDTEAGKP